MCVIRFAKKCMSYVKKIILKIIRKIRCLFQKNKNVSDEEKNIYEVLKYDELYEKVCNYDIVSFDIFDTLITRTVYDPVDLFKLMEQKLNINSFVEKRKNAEIEAINKLKKDVNIDEIYKSYKELYKIPSNKLDKIKTLEKELELQLCIPRSDMLKLVKKLVNNQRRIILVSDMYLDKTTIIRMLEKCGYNENMFKDIYISNDINKRKDNKKMWKYIHKIYRKYKIIHLGDNNNSDVLFPMKYKIDAVKIMSPRNLLMKTELYEPLLPYIENRTTSDSLFLGIMINRKMFNSPFSDLKIHSIGDFGYIFHAPVLNEFLKFINDKTKNIDELLFLAREGYYLQKLYKDYNNLYNIKNKKNIYFLASRKATHTATIYDDMDIYRLKEFKGTFKSFMNQIFDIEVDDESKIVIPDDIELVKKKLRPYIKKILKNSEKERNVYLKYIEENIGQYHNKKIAIVDLGYSGTIQLNLTRLTKREMTGIYLTNSTNIKKYSKNSKLLYYFDIKENDYYKNILYYSLLLEFFLSAPHGQLQKFEIKCGKIKPIFNNEVLSKKKEADLEKIYNQVKIYMKDLKDITDVYDVNISKELLTAFYKNIIDSNIISQNVKDCFNFMDSFETSSSKNIFKWINKY